MSASAESVIPRSTDVLLNWFRKTTVAIVRDDFPDLTGRQTAVFLTVYLKEEEQTVRGLASALMISKPAITRALDRLAEFDLIRRRVDQNDRRSILVDRTLQGKSHLRSLGSILVDASRERRERN
jgi:DNA-binding MarR family transcriptional regulator